jgi:hypothetical protein
MSDKQLRANQSNALRSTGPKTQEGKARCKMNALKHGLASRHFIIDGEDPLYVDELIAELVEVHQAYNADEHLLIERIAHGLIMGQRGRHIMQQYYHVAERGGPERYIDYIPLIQRYLKETERSVERAYELLFRIRAERRKQNTPVSPENGSVPGPEYFAERKISSRPIPPLKTSKAA